MKLLDLPAVGTSNFLRFNLRMKLRQLEADDRVGGMGERAGGLMWAGRGEGDWEG